MHRSFVRSLDSEEASTLRHFDASTLWSFDAFRKLRKFALWRGWALLVFTVARYSVSVCRSLWNAGVCWLVGCFESCNMEELKTDSTETDG